MILLDNRIGAKELFPLFQSHTHTPTKLTRLEFADIAFLGVGEGGVPVQVGIERKRFGDLLSSISSGRLSSHQLPGLMAAYNVVYLVVEGIWRVNADTGMVERWTRGKGRGKDGGGGWQEWRFGNERWTGNRVYGYLNTLELKAGVHIHHTATPMETVQWANRLYKWWSKGWDEHTSHIGTGCGKLPSPCGGMVQLSKPTLMRRIAKELPGIGTKLSGEVMKYFSCAGEMVLASEKDWMRMPGVGKGIAEKVVLSFWKD
jgi:ERCC4-type nuclease